MTFIVQIYFLSLQQQNIYKLNIDERLKNEDLSLVDDIANVKELNKRFYSFATKYCSHHNPDVFPIFDNYVSRVLIYFRNQDNFASFKIDDLRDYIIFNEVLNQFAKFYNLEEYSKKELDIYLWQLGKEYFKRY